MGYWPGTDSKVTADADAKAVSDGPKIVFDGITGFDGSYPGASIVASGKPVASGIVDASAPFDSHADFTHGDFNKGDFVPGYTVVGDHAAADAQAHGFDHGTSTKVSQCTGQEQTPRLLLMLMQRLFLMDQRSSSMVSQDLMDHTQVLLLLHQESHKLAELLMLQHHSIAMLTLLMVTSTRETLFQVTLLLVIMLQLMLLLMPKLMVLTTVCTSTKVSQCTGQEQTPRLLLMLMQRLFLMDHTSSSMVSQDLMEYIQMLFCHLQASHKLAELLMLQHHSIAMLTLLMVPSTRENLCLV